MHLAVLPDVRAAQNPQRPCLADDDTRLNNAEFRARVLAATETLARHGIGAGDVVAVMLPNQAELVITLFAAWRLGAAVTPVNPWLAESEAKYQLTDSGAKLLVSHIGTFPVDTIDPALLCAKSVTTDAGSIPVAEDASALALLIYTSGTTGTPKGVMLDHANLSAMCAMGIEATDVSEDDHSLLILPLFHVNGIVVSILSPLLAGGQATIAGRFNPETFFQIVEKVRPTFFSAVPAIYAMLSARPEDERPDVSSVRMAICGAAPMPAELIERFEGRFGFPIVEGYGLSEGTCGSTINPVGQRKPGTVGLPMPGQRVAIIDADDRILPHGETGEVVIQGPNVMRGYLNRPEETAMSIVNGWLHTGDVGRFDEDGYLVLVDRIKDLIIRGGENIYPKEIESVLYGHPKVLEAAVIGAADDVLGEVPVAYVVARPESAPTTGDLLDRCQGALAKYKWPAEIRIVPSLPKNQVGKIDKRALREQLTAGAAGRN